MASKWIEFVKAYSKKNNMSYTDAGTKGAPSKTMRGKEDFSTKKSDVRRTARRAFEKK